MIVLAKYSFVRFIFFQTLGGSILSGKSNSDVIILLIGCGAFVNVESGLLLLVSNISLWVFISEKKYCSRSHTSNDSYCRTSMVRTPLKP